MSVTTTQARAMLRRRSRDIRLTVFNFSSRMRNQPMSCEFADQFLDVAFKRSAFNIVFFQHLSSNRCQVLSVGQKHDDPCAAVVETVILAVCRIQDHHFIGDPLQQYIGDQFVRSSKHGTVELYGQRVAFKSRSTASHTASR